MFFFFLLYIAQSFFVKPWSKVKVGIKCQCQWWKWRQNHLWGAWYEGTALYIILSVQHQHYLILVRKLLMLITLEDTYFFLPVGRRVGLADTAQVHRGALSDVTWRTHQHTSVFWRVWTHKHRKRKTGELFRQRSCIYFKKQNRFRQHWCLPNMWILYCRNNMQIFSFRVWRKANQSQEKKPVNYENQNGCRLSVCM